jgi:hypothetical protein
MSTMYSRSVAMLQQSKNALTKAVDTEKEYELRSKLYSEFIIFTKV